MLLPVAPDVFLDRNMRQGVAFYRDAAGQVTGCGCSGYFYTRV